VTRADRAAPEQAMRAAEEARALARRLGLGDRPAIVTSAATGRGLPDLAAALGALADPPAAEAEGAWMPLDRAFSLPGAARVVTGAPRRGVLRVGEEVEILPGRRPAPLRLARGQHPRRARRHRERLQPPRAALLPGRALREREHRGRAGHGGGAALHGERRRRRGPGRRGGGGGQAGRVDGHARAGDRGRPLRRVRAAPREGPAPAEHLAQRRQAAQRPEAGEQPGAERHGRGGPDDPQHVVPARAGSARPEQIPFRWAHLNG
jgi:hypothetical protein